MFLLQKKLSVLFSEIYREDCHPYQCHLYSDLGLQARFDTLFPVAV